MLFRNFKLQFCGLAISVRKPSPGGKVAPVRTLGSEEEWRQNRFYTQKTTEHYRIKPGVGLYRSQIGTLPPAFLISHTNRFRRAD